MTPTWCHRIWHARNGGFSLCTLRRGHGGTRCIDTINNVSHPTAATSPPTWCHQIREGQRP